MTRLSPDTKPLAQKTISKAHKRSFQAKPHHILKPALKLAPPSPPRIFRSCVM